MRRRRNPSGDILVQVSSKEWEMAMARLEAELESRFKRLASWEQGKDRSVPDFWEAYGAEKYRIPVTWPLPVGHVFWNGDDEAQNYCHVCGEHITYCDCKGPRE